MRKRLVADMLYYLSFLYWGIIITTHVKIINFIKIINSLYKGISDHSASSLAHATWELLSKWK